MEPYQTRETWQVTKAVVRGDRGLVSTQHYLASEAGAMVLRDGGNAMDAAVAAGLALGVVEPWMSGIGGGGFMQHFDASSGEVRGLDFAMVAPMGLDPGDYPLVQGTNASDKFNWPSVLDDRHTAGPYSIAVPGYLAGAGMALSQFGTWSWADVMAPSLELVRFGLPVDWFASHKITNSARDLRNFPASRRMYLADGLPPVGPINGEIFGLSWRELVGTYERLAQAGPDDFYRGELAAAMALDAKDVGSSLRERDLQAYRAEPFDGVATNYRGAKIWAPQGLNAGPSLEEALGLLETRLAPSGAHPSVDAYTAYADVLLKVYEGRLATMGVGQGAGSGNTSHLGVVDRAGNTVSWTQTIMSAFGSKVVMPRTGVTMNNGIMWFDPTPQRPNSIRPGARPLSNMCPTIVERADGFRFAIGACGGRKIFPAVFQLTSFLVDYEMDLDAAINAPRVDVSGTEEVSVDERLEANVVAALMNGRRCTIAVNGVYPNRFGLPNVVGSLPGAAGFVGAAFVGSPTAAIVGP